MGALRSFALIAVMAAPAAAIAQAITADGTLGTSVGSAGDAYTIGGGTVKGTNLFHSFGQFNVPTAGSATFDGPAATQNVISRVTGGTSSTIDGLISTRGGASPMPSANFYLINPSGVVFGANAALDVGGSFRVSTADYIRLDDGVIFSATPGPGDALLSSAPPQAFGFLSANPAPISVEGAILLVDPPADPSLPGQTLSLIGGDVQLRAGAALLAPGGLAQIISVGSPGVVDLALPDLGLGSFSRLGRVTISEGSGVSAGGSPLDLAIIGGTVEIRGGELIIDAAVVATDVSDFGGAAVGIRLSGRDSIVVSGGSSVISFSTGSSNASAISITGGQLTVTGNGTTIETQGGLGSGSTAGALDIQVANANILAGAKIQTISNFAGANITISASGTVTLAGAGSEILAGSGSDSAELGGNISVVASNVTLQDSATINSGTAAGLQGGQTLNVSAANTLSISSAAGISSIAFEQNVGSLHVSASQLAMDGGYINATTLGTGNAGQVLVNANTVSLVNGAQIASSSQGAANAGAGGGITINAPGSVMISGAASGLGLGDITLSRTASSGLFSTTETSGGAGQITVSTPTLTLSDRARISVATKAAGNAGVITANVGSLGLSGGARIDSNTTAGGAGGAIAVNGALSIAGVGSGLFSTASSTGNAGAITVTSPTLMLGDGGRISVTTEAGGNAGTVIANVVNFNISGGARVDSSTTAGGAGGSITVNATGGVEIGGTGSGLFSTASSTGNAGQVTVSAPTLTVSAGGKISVVSTGAGDAGSVIATGTNVLVTTGGQIDSSTTGAGDGGAINIGALRVEIRDGGSVRADSTGAGLTGNITIAATDRIIMSEGSISTRAVSSDGGNITLTAPNVIRLENSQITTSVESGAGGGGNVFIDPQFVIMDGSSITANAFGGPGGNITIVANNFVTDPTSFLSASSALSTPGTVRIESPDNNLASDIAQLPRELVDASRLMRGGCTARRTGAPSSFVVAGRGGVPADPDGYLPSFSASSAPYAGARGAAVSPGIALAMAGLDCWQ